MKEKVKVVIYARQSSGDDEDSASVEQQVANCQKLAKEHGYSVIGTFKDLNISGKFYPDTAMARNLCEGDRAVKIWLSSTNFMQIRYRQGLGKAFALLPAVDYILLDDFTRLMRPLTNSFLGDYIKQTLAYNNVLLHSVKEGIVNPNSLADNLMTTITSQINANQLEIQRQKSKAALKKLRDDGFRASGSKMRGYRRIGKHQYEIVPEEADLIREAFEMGIANIPYMSICRTLSPKYNFKDLHYDTLMNIYSRPEYAGYCYNSQGELIESKCFGSIPIITLHQFMRMQDRLKNKRVHNHDRKNTYAFTGLCYCGYCGGRMQVMSCSNKQFKKENEPRSRLYYFTCVRNVYREHNKECSKSHLRNSYPVTRSAKEPIKRIPVTREDLNNPVIPSRLQNMGLHESLMPLVILPLLEEQKQLNCKTDLHKKIEKMDIEKRVISDKQHKISVMYNQGALEDEQFALMSRDLKERKASLSKEIEVLTAQTTMDIEKEKKELKVTIYRLHRKRIEDNLYKKYAQALIKEIRIYGYHVEILFVNGKSFTLERIPKAAARLMPNWSLTMNRNKAYIKYYYKSFYKGDIREQVIYDDKDMNIVTVGCNPPPRAWASSKNHRWDWRKQELTKITNGVDVSPQTNQE